MTVAPQRLRLSRARGFDLQAVSRALNGLPARSVARPGPFGNPYEVGLDGDAAHCVALFAHLLAGDLALGMRTPVAVLEARRAVILDGIPDLRGRNLACWCARDRPCHADVLLALANAEGAG